MSYSGTQTQAPRSEKRATPPSAAQRVDSGRQQLEHHGRHTPSVGSPTQIPTQWPRSFCAWHPVMSGYAAAWMQASPNSGSSAASGVGGTSSPISHAPQKNPKTNTNTIRDMAPIVGRLVEVRK